MRVGLLSASSIALAMAIAASLAAAPAGRAPPAAPAAAPAEAPITLPRTIDPAGKPQINGPRVTGGTPGKQFFFLVPATGDAPLTFAAENLPPGLTLDAQTGVITGSIRTPGVVVTTFKVSNAKGQASKPIVIVGGTQKLALTPPLGWNSWNVWGLSVTQEKVKAAADGFVSSGLAAHGFQYVNIDDGWEINARPQGRGGRGRGAATQPAADVPPPPPPPVLRAPDGTILVNEKFPDMKGLGDYIHSKGMRFGIYSSPGPTTCGGYAASWQHEEQDARTWASWGVDYIKYDWCSYSNVVPPPPATQGGGRGRNNYDLPTLKKPYQVIRTAIDKLDRDMVLSLCQYGWGNVWEWGAQPDIGGNLWRATGDINDSWPSMSNIGFAQNGHEQSVGPGHWNDTDMLVVGKVGWGPRTHDSRLTQNEQITHISLWSILAAPMLLGCDMSALDEFTINLMSNDEVLAVNQDPMGKMGHRISPAGTGQAANRAEKQVWARPLWDGTMAVGLFNLGNEPAEVSVNLADLNISGQQPVRDLWQLKDLAPANGTVTATVPRHGTVLLKIGKPKPDAECIADLVKLHSAK